MAIKARTASAGNAFKPGNIFPELAGKKNGEREKIQVGQIRRYVSKEKEGSRWKQIDTPLKEYVYFPGKGVPKFNFEEFLLKKINAAEKRGEKLRVLDVGIGTGRQWADFLEKHGHRFEFVGTVIYKHYIHPKMEAVLRAGKAKIIPSTAANLHNKFLPNYFDLAVSNFGTHYQEKEALESLVHVLKPGGEAMVSGGSTLQPPTSEKHGDVYRLITEFRIAKPPNYWRYHLRKLRQ